MTKDELKNIFEQYSFLRKKFYFGRKDGNNEDKFCLVYRKTKKIYEVYYCERGKKWGLRELNSELEAYTYLWELFGGYNALKFFLESPQFQ